jgi:hypothetical protein
VVAASIAIALAAGRATPTIAARLREPVVDLGLGDRAPVVLVRSQAAEQAWLAECVHGIRAHSAPGDAIFAFPDLAGLGFLADRRMPFYYLYFVPGRPDHAQEADVIARLGAVRPSVVVTAPPSAPAFAGATEYFGRTVGWVAERYTPVAQAGRCTVLAPRANGSTVRP